MCEYTQDRKLHDPGEFADREEELPCAEVGEEDYFDPEICPARCLEKYSTVCPICEKTELGCTEKLIHNRSILLGEDVCCIACSVSLAGVVIVYD